MSLVRSALVAFAALVALFAADSRSIAADVAVSGSAPSFAVSGASVAARQAPCCGTIVGDS